MIRPFTFITMLLAALSGAYLFAVKHRAQVLDDQIAQIADQSRLDAQRIRVLQAQWALEIDPTRLTQLASQFTTLQPMKPAQLVTLAALRDSLPPPDSQPPGANPAGSAPPLPVVADAAPPANGLPMPPDPAPVAPPVTAVHLAAAHMAARPREAAAIVHHRLGATRQPVEMAQSLPMGAQVMTVKAVSQPPAPADEGGSMLGMAQDMPPPQPLADNGTPN
jgi:hypothetical protein